MKEYKSINDCPVKQIEYYRMVIAECEKEIEWLEKEAQIRDIPLTPHED